MVLKKLCPVKLVGRGEHRGFQSLRQGIKLRGLTKRLQAKLFSNGSLPSIAKHGSERRCGWDGQFGGMRRGTAVDSQISRAINSGNILPQKKQYVLTKLALIALHNHGLVPIVAQRGCCAEQFKIATAADIVCYECSTGRVVVVELKCGHSGSKTACAQINGEPCKMNSPVSSACDNVLNRHMAQLAVTRELIARETDTISKLNDLGVASEIGANLLYVNNDGTELFSLPEWWLKRAPKILSALQ